MPIKLHWGQSKIYRDLFIDRAHRFVVNNCSRGWGKSYFAASAACTAIFELMELPVNVPNKVVYIIAPTYDQVKDIYFPLVAYDLGMEQWALKSSRDLGRFLFPRNVELRLVSYETVERMRGKGAYFVVWDEVSSCLKGIDPKEAWESVIYPCITTRWSVKRAQAYGAKSPGRALIISTPKGFNYFYDLYNFRELDERWSSYHFDYTQSPFLDIAEIDKARENMDPIKFASEYLASFKESGNNVFYMFDRTKHVRKDLPDFFLGDNKSKREDIHAMIDFNVGIQATSICAIRGGQVHVLDEMKGHPDTETLALALRQKYEGHKIFAYPDPSGKARKSSAPVGVTDFTILQSAGIQVLSRQSAPPISDSVQAVNRMLETASGKMNFFVHPRCKGVIESLERTKWVDNKPETAVIDKTEGIEHFSDGIRYGVEYMFPVVSHQKRTSRGFGF
jgi:hypothetical protein